MRVTFYFRSIFRSSSGVVVGGDAEVLDQILQHIRREERRERRTEKVTQISQRTTRAKLLSYFSAEAQRLGRYEFDIPFSRQQLADYLAVERSGLSLELGKLKKEGLLDFHKNHFVLRI